jgi:hypothetical protein
MIKFKPRAQIRTYEGAFELQNSHNHDLTVDCLVELGSKARLKKLRKQSLSLREESTVTVTKLTEEAWTH